MTVLGDSLPIATQADGVCSMATFVPGATVG